MRVGFSARLLASADLRGWNRYNSANFGIPWSLPILRVLTLHDAIDTAYYARRQLFKQRLSVAARRSRLAHAASRRLADRVITMSPHAWGDLVRWLGWKAMAEAYRKLVDAKDGAASVRVEVGSE